VRELEEGYETALAQAPPEAGARELGTPQATPARHLAVGGPGARYLNELEKRVDAVEKAVAVRDDVACEQAIAEA